MAVVRDSEIKKLQLSVESGVTETGKAKIATRTFSNIKTDATDDDLYAIGSGLGELQDYPVSAIKVNDTATLIE